MAKRCCWFGRWKCPAQQHPTGGSRFCLETDSLTTDEMASHSHAYYLDTTKKGTSNDKAWLVDAGTVGDKITDHPRTTEPIGGNQPHENMPPSIASYGWRRTA